jgi:hypothetical protein
MPYWLEEMKLCPNLKYHATLMLRPMSKTDFNYMLEFTLLFKEIIENIL